ncbi:maleylpyruvate isomerase family mycothiol-dependent enzyme [Brachybacterium sp. FME24]|uniref:maleylpyruvate isomerase family mycothiol-dependent enzyme n=1 Tax=Brachybacterium sp. FME24 TaxID=2742605 RepID=UPI001867A7BD|nr:maleylpyruvate isomerase family mycothiol-dependent enzyme [Brachybacterium sp. FME24]
MSTRARTSTTPDSVLTTWQERSAPFTATVQAVDDWEAPSPCEGWTARDVLEHVCRTQRDFFAQRGLELSDLSGAEPAQTWAAHHREVSGLLGDPDVAQRAFDGAFGPTTVGATMIDFYGFDLIVHRWDLARSQGLDARLTPQELALIDAAVDGWGEHAYAPGIFAGALPTSPGVDEQTRVLARTGRRG